MQVTQAVEKITEETLVGLPAPVQRYMRYSGMIGKTPIDTAHLKYRGEFRLGADKPWMPMRADQVYTTDPPGFQWRAKFKMLGLPMMSAVDTYKDGQGHMFGKLGGLFTVFDDRSDELLQGTMVRYLQEVMWFPTAYLGKYITWHAVDDHAADVSFAYAGKQVGGRVYFDNAGRVLSFIADRYRENNGNQTLNTWATPMTEYGMFDGFRVPCAGWGVWQLPEGDLSYVKLRVTEITYNMPIREF